MEVLFDPHPIPPSDEGGRVKKGEKMKTEKETKQDELAAIGIGAMIVFIALILVAAVAAAVIIQTAEKLQQNAQASGDDTQEQMSTKLTLINVVIETMDAGTPNYELFEARVTHDGSNAFISKFGRIGNTATELAAITADISGGNVRLRGQITNTNTTQVKFVRRIMNTFL